jgi:hypothetical protein
MMSASPIGRSNSLAAIREQITELAAIRPRLPRWNHGIGDPLSVVHSLD